MLGSQTNEQDPPALQSLTIPTFDVSQGSLPPLANFTISNSDNGSLLLTLDHTLLLSFSTQRGGIDYQPGSTVYLELDKGQVATYDVIDLAAASGTYAVTKAVLSDSAGSTIYSAADLQRMGFSTSLNVIGDTTAPTLSSFTISRHDAGPPGGSAYEFDVSVNDVGLARAIVHLDRPVIASDGSTSTDVIIDHGVSYDTLPGYFGTSKPGFVTVPDTSLPPGSYHVTGLTLIDYAGNRTDYTSGELAASGDAITFTVATEPMLTSLHLPSTIDVRSSVHAINLQASVVDTGSTIAQVVLTLDNPVEDAGQPNHGLHNPTATTTLTGSFQNDGTVVTYPVLDPDTQAGHYAVVSAVVTDQAGGTTSYDTAQLAALGFSTGFDILSDTSPPALTALSLPAAVLAGEGFAVVVGVTDPTPSVGIVSGTLQLTGPDGAVTNIAIERALDPSRNYEYNAFNSGLGEAHTTLSAPGKYVVSGVTVQDYVGNSTTFSTAQLAAMGYTTDIIVAQPGNLPQAAPTGDFAYNGSAGTDDLYLNGNVQDYALSRVSSNVYSREEPIRTGDFVLTGLNGSGAVSIAQSIEIVHFQNGQYLALQDLPTYIAGSAALSLGGSGDDQLFQTRAAGYEAFVGGDGNDQLYLKGNVQDYSVRNISAVVAPGDAVVKGIELVGDNDSGALIIDSSVETIHFQDGQYLAFGDIASYVHPAASLDAVLHLLPDELAAGSAAVIGSTDRNDTLLLNGTAADYSLSRDQTTGAFVLSGEQHSVSIDQTIDTVQFGNGQYLALRDMPSYLSGHAQFTVGTAGDDLLFTPLSGDQYVVGGGGTDNLYINGNTHDYSIKQVMLSATDNHPAIVGVELIGLNGSGDIYIDRTVETIHFQDGQYLALNDLHSYIG